MKRLTDKRLALPPGVWQEVTREQRMELQEIPVPSMRELYYRLSQIEDILCDGTDEYNLDRLRELAEADRDGRCVVLPCKVGDTAYKIGASICMWRETDHCDEYCNGYEYRDCWEGRRAVLEDKFSLDELPIFGKTVFLTREAAEAALKVREQE